MVQKTPIEWVAEYDKQGNLIAQGYTSNPIYAINMETGKRGHFCTKISLLCAHCYAEAWNMFRGNGLPYTSASLDKIEWVLNEKELTAIRKLKGHHKIFLGDMTDIFHPAIPDRYREAVFDTIDERRDLTFMILTKRPDKANDFFQTVMPYFYAPHLWLGVSVGNTELDKIDTLKQLDIGDKYFLSLEPLLAPIPNLFDYLDGVQLAIVGAESGRGARPMKEEWARGIKDQCITANVPFFLKQYATAKGKKISLPMLDGQQWVQMPEVHK